MVVIMDYSKSTIKNIMKKFDIQCVTLIWVPYYLTKEQLQQRVDVSKHL